MLGTYLPFAVVWMRDTHQKSWKGRWSVVKFLALAVTFDMGFGSSISLKWILGRGYGEFHSMDSTKRPCRIGSLHLGAESAGAAPLMDAFQRFSGDKNGCQIMAFLHAMLYTLPRSMVVRRRAGPLSFTTQKHQYQYHDKCHQHHPAQSSQRAPASTLLRQILYVWPVNLTALTSGLQVSIGENNSSKHVRDEI